MHAFAFMQIEPFSCMHEHACKCAKLPACCMHALHACSRHDACMQCMHEACMQCMHAQFRRAVGILYSLMKYNQKVQVHQGGRTQFYRTCALLIIIYFNAKYFRYAQERSTELFSKNCSRSCR